jgi:hypothetical protein
MQVLRQEGLEGEVIDEEVEPLENAAPKVENGPALVGTELCNRLTVYLAAQRNRRV